MFFVVDPDVELLVDYFFARDDLLLTSAKLTEVLKTRKLKPREIYSHDITEILLKVALNTIKQTNEHA
jgi:hypothetical protein